MEDIDSRVYNLNTRVGILTRENTNQTPTMASKINVKSGKSGLILLYHFKGKNLLLWILGQE